MSISIDLVAMYGIETLTKGQEFATGAGATAFIKDYSLRGNNHITVTSSGRCKKYRCKYGDCEWFVTCVKSKREPFNFYVSSINDRHSDECIVVARPSKRQIASLPEFRVAVLSNRTVSMRSLATTVQSTSRISLQNQASKVYRAKDAVATSQAGDYDESFTRLPALLRELSDANPGSTIALENDQEGRFFRVFVCLAGTVKCLSMCQPIYGFDGAHFKQSKYTGQALTLVTRDGNSKNFPVAFALVSSENADNVSWFIRLCVKAAVPLGESAVPLFCDRRVLLAAAASLERDEDLCLNLKYCTAHIIRNINKNFKVSGQKLDSHIWSIQEADTYAKYQSAMAALKSDFGERGPLVERYVREIPPDRWTLLDANSKLYGWRSTNFVESNNSVLDRNGFRRDSPFEAIQVAVKQAMKAISSRASEYDRWVKAKRRFTPHASFLLQETENDSGSYDVAKSSSSVYFVNRLGFTKENRVSLNPVGCSCTTFRQLGLPCRHILSVLHATNQDGRLAEAFDTCYLTSTFEGFASAPVELAVDAKLDPSTTVLAPPSNRQLGRRTLRIRSGGETGSARVYRCRGCGASSRHNKRTCRRHGQGQTAARPAQLFGTEVDFSQEVMLGHDALTSSDDDDLHDVENGILSSPNRADGQGRLLTNDDPDIECTVDQREDGRHQDATNLPRNLAFLLN